MTDRPVTADTAAALRRLADSAAADDPVVGQELADHLEDALLDYTAGRRRPTEADALLLVEHQLGDPDQLSALLTGVHGRTAPVPATVPAADRLLSLVTGTAAAWASVDLLIAVAGHLVPRPTDDHWRPAAVLEAGRWLAPVLAAVALWWWLQRFARPTAAASRNRRAWVAIGSVLACLAAPLVQTPPYLYTVGGPFWSAAALNDEVRWARVVGAIAIGAVWLAWGARGRRWRSSAPVVMAGWALTMTALDLLRARWMAFPGSRPWGSPVGPSARTWRLDGPSLQQSFMYTIPDAGSLLMFIAVLLAARMVWDRLRPAATDVAPAVK